MNKEKKYLITLCREYLYGKTQALDKNVDYLKLYELSNAHNLSPILFCVIKNAPNKEIVAADAYEKFENDFFEAVFRYNVQSSVISELSAVFDDSDIKYVFFKGSEIRNLYPVPQSRVMGDIDVLINAEDRDKAKEILVKNGFELVNSNGPVYDYSRCGALVEVHTKIISGKVGSSNAESCFLDAMENAEFDSNRGSLDINYHFAYLLTHIAHHFWFYGAGVKLILDLAVIQMKYNIDYNILFKKMEEIGLKKFSKVILSVCKKWFSVGQDFGVATEKTEQFLVSFGAFGNLNRNKAAVIERKELEEGKKNSAFMTRLRLAFPPYEKVKNIPYISFIEGRPYLLLAAWIYRIGYNLKNRRAFVKRASEAIGKDETKSQAKQELAYFKEIGLV